MKADLRKSQILIKKKKKTTKNTIKNQQMATIAKAREAKHTSWHVMDKMELFLRVIWKTY